MNKFNAQFEDFEKRLKYLDSTNHLDFIIQYESNNNQLYCVGLEDKKLKYMMLNYEFGLYVGAKDLAALLPLKYNNLVLDIKEITCPKLTNSNSNPFVEMFEEKEPVKLFKIVTSSFNNSKNLYFHLNKWQYQQTVSIFPGWSLDIFLSFSFSIDKDKLVMPKFKQLPLYFIQGDLVDGVLKLKENNKPFDHDLIIFDLETVSPNPKRVPTGENMSDVLFSSSILKRVDGKEYLYCIINLPNVEVGTKIKENKEELLKYLHPTAEIEIIICNNEYDTLEKTMNFMKMDNFSFMFGWNSTNFDLQFLTYRLFYYEMWNHLEEMYYEHTMASFGHQTIHIDYYIFMKKFTTFPNYKLATIASECLGSTKVDISAEYLRHVYSYYCTNSDIDHIFNDGHTDFTLDVAVLYNNIDVLLVYKLLNINNTIVSCRNLCDVYTISIVKLAFCQIFEMLLTKIIKESLEFFTFLSFNHNHKIITLPLGMMVVDENKITSLNSDGEGKFCGGFNYVRGSHFYNQLGAFDYVAYYPNTMETNNLSYETTSILPANLVKIILMNAKDKDKIVIRKFVDRRGKNMFETQLLCRSLVMGNENCGDEITTFKELDDLKEEKVLIISNKSRGLFSKILEKQNIVRDVCKDQKKSFTAIIENLQYIKSLKLSGDAPPKYKNQVEKLNTKVAKYKFLQSLIKVNYFELYNGPMENIDNLIDGLVGEQNRLEGIYRAFKIENCSFYGLLGSNTGVQSKTFAASVAFLCAMYIITTGKEAQKLGARLAFSDTDSVFIDERKKNVSQKLINIMQNKNKGLILGYKTYDNVFIFAKKVYIGMYENEMFSRGINKNGPKLWNDIMEFVYKKYLIPNKELYINQILQIYTDIYTLLFNAAKNNIESVQMVMNIKELSEYKTKTAAAKMLERALAINPNLDFGKKVSFYVVFDTNISVTRFDLTVDSYKNINMYKFASKPFTKINAMINYLLMQTYSKINITVDFLKEIKNINKQAFIVARSNIQND